MFSEQSGITLKKYINDIKKELFRKTIHLCTAFIPFLLAHFFSVTLCLLITVGLLYSVSELLRLHGIQVPLISEITEAAARKRDEDRFVLGPLTLVCGIIITALLWKQPAAAIGIFALAFGDGLASLAGKLFGTVHIPGTSGKTVAGSLACFTAIFCSTWLYTHNTRFALIIAIAGMFIEVLPLKDFDNLLIPVLLGGISQILLP